MLEDLIAQIAGAGTNDVAIVLGRLEYRAAVGRQLLLVSGFATFARHLTDNATSLLKNALVVEDSPSLATCSLAIVFLIVEGVGSLEFRIHQVVLAHLGSSLLLEKLLHVFGDGRRNVSETVTSLVLGRGEEASILIEVPVDLLNFGHFPARHGRRAKTTIGRSTCANLILDLAS